MRQTLTSSRGMVTAPHHLAASSACAVLREGGNAVDAGIACALVQGVVDPLMWLSPLVTMLAMVCPFDPPEKQALLEAAEGPQRAEMLVALLRMGAAANVPNPGSLSRGREDPYD